MSKPENLRQISQDEIGRMEQELSRMEMNLYDSYCEVGKAILETAETEGRKINDLVDQIVDARRRLVDAKEEKYCPECAEHNDRNSLYCKRCGEKLDKKREDCDA